MIAIFKLILGTCLVLLVSIAYVHTSCDAKVKVKGHYTRGYRTYVHPYSKSSPKHSNGNRRTRKH